MLLCLPVLTVLLFALIQFSMVVSASQKLAAASAVGARVAAQGGDEEEIARVVKEVLGPGALGSAAVEAVLTDETGRLLGPGEPVEVIVQIPSADAVPDLLGHLGVKVMSETLAGRTVLRKE
jgi:hypothetical protein